MSEEKEIVILNPEEFELILTKDGLADVEIQATFSYHGAVCGVFTGSIYVQTPAEFDNTNYTSAMAIYKATAGKFLLSQAFLADKETLWDFREPFESTYGLPIEKAGEAGELTIDVKRVSVTFVRKHFAIQRIQGKTDAVV